ncbi:hypothetical protein KPH14_011174 [Odynerus spinipes]|uniref:Uncharacterized protein n=1 Tax=Odynerus spinipes TaxID=1348599 RepID=A0AAD9VLN6_9HYME|nr:hypothetical protein KPH14_011174 [Odynerus spinipes]
MRGSRSERKMNIDFARSAASVTESIPRFRTRGILVAFPPAVITKATWRRRERTSGQSGSGILVNPVIVSVPECFDGRSSLNGVASPAEIFAQRLYAAGLPVSAVIEDGYPKGVESNQVFRRIGLSGGLRSRQAANFRLRGDSAAGMAHALGRLPREPPQIREHPIIVQGGHEMGPDTPTQWGARDH